MKLFATITVIGRDKTGVIARITNFLFQQHANIEALEEQVTRGQFSMTLQASWDRSALNTESVISGLNAFAQELAMEIKIRFREPRRRQRAAIFVTKEEHCLQGLIEAFGKGILKADPLLVISNRSDLKAIAAKAGYKFLHIPWNERAEAEAAALAALESAEIDFVILARFMKILSPNFVWRFKNKIINIHPSLLPSFPGPQAYRQAYEHGVKIVGVTAHFVSMHLDEGPIITQESFPVKSHMTLKELVSAGQRLETKALIRAVRLYLAKKLDVHWGVVKEV